MLEGSFGQICGDDSIGLVSSVLSSKLVIFHMGKVLCLEDSDSSSDNVIEVRKSSKDSVLALDKVSRTLCAKQSEESPSSLVNSKMKSYFEEMGFSSDLIDKALGENGECSSNLNDASILETLFTYADNAAPEFKEDNKASLLMMNFSDQEVDYAISRLGTDAPIGGLVDCIVAARIAKRSNIPDTESTLFEKALRLLEMGFLEDDIYSAIEIRGPEAPVQELAESIVANNSNSPIDQDQDLSTFECHSSETTAGETRMFNTIGSCANGVGSSKIVTGKRLIYENDQPIDDPWHGSMVTHQPKLYTTSSSKVHDGKRLKCESDQPMGDPMHRVMILHQPKSKLLHWTMLKPPYFLYGNSLDVQHQLWSKLSKSLYELEPVLLNAEAFSGHGSKNGIIHNLPAENRFNISQKSSMPNKNRSHTNPEEAEIALGYPRRHTAEFSSPMERFKSLQRSFQTDALGYYLSALKRKFPDGVTVLSICSGIGGAEVALHHIGVRLKCVISVEACETNRRILHRWWNQSGQEGKLIQIDDITSLNLKKVDDLNKTVGGFDLVVCNNPWTTISVSSLKRNRAYWKKKRENIPIDEVLKDHEVLDLTMFYEFVRVLTSVRSAV